MGGDAKQFTRDLQALYVAAGSPPLTWIVSQGSGQKPPVVFSDSTLSDWLKKGAVPANAAHFKVLVSLLEGRAANRVDPADPDSNYKPRGFLTWEKARAAARTERRPGLGGESTHAQVQDPSSEPAASEAVLGVPIGQCDPLDLEVHPAGDGPGRNAQRHLPGYVRRAHDDVLAAVVERVLGGASELAVLVGSSSTGKTRACWEAVQPLAQLGWRLWHPFDPTRADAALAGLEAVGPRTVVWLNEMQHYLDIGERMAAALHRVLTDPDRGPVLVLGTLWPDYFTAYLRRPAPGRPDGYARARELLAGRRVEVPDGFDDDALTRARDLASQGDRLLAAVLGRRHDGRVTQHLAGAPQLLDRYHTMSPPARALLHAAIDARRLRAGPYLPLAFLADAAPGYLHAEEYDALGEHWMEQALEELAEPVHGDLAPLRRVRERPDHRPSTAAQAQPSRSGPETRLYRLADYLEHHGRRERWDKCPPASFWHAALAYIADPDALDELATAASDRYRLQWADALYRRAAEAGHPGALDRLKELRERAGDRDGVEALYRTAAAAGDTFAMCRLAWLRQEAGDLDGAETLYWRAVDAGESRALVDLARMRENAGDLEGAEALYRRAADAGDPETFVELGELRERDEDWAGAAACYQRAADGGHPDALSWTADLLERAGDSNGAELTACRVGETGDTRALFQLADARNLAGDRERAEALYRRAADAGDVRALIELAEMRERAGDRDGAQALAARAADAGRGDALSRLARVREKAGDRVGAEALYRQAVDIGDARALIDLARMREEVGDRQGAEALYRRAADDGDSDALIELARFAEDAGDQEAAGALYRRVARTGWENAEWLVELGTLRHFNGDQEGAEAIYRAAGDAGFPPALRLLAEMRTKDGDHAGAEAVLRRAVDIGDAGALIRLGEMRQGSGDRAGAEAMYRRALDAGATEAVTHLATVRARAGNPAEVSRLTRYGLDPDGAVTRPW